MRRILTSCGLALVAVSPLAGQAGVSEPRGGADGKPVTITGCLGGGAPKFVITNVLVARPAGGKDDGSARPVGLLSSYALVPGEGVAHHLVEAVACLLDHLARAADERDRVGERRQHVVQKRLDVARLPRPLVAVGARDDRRGVVDGIRESNRLAAER